MVRLDRALVAPELSTDDRAQLVDELAALLRALGLVDEARAVLGDTARLAVTEALIQVRRSNVAETALLLPTIDHIAKRGHPGERPRAGLVLGEARDLLARTTAPEHTSRPAS